MCTNSALLLHMGLTLMVMLPLTIAAPAGSAPRFLNAH